MWPGIGTSTSADSVQAAEGATSAAVRGSTAASGFSSIGEVAGSIGANRRASRDATRCCSGGGIGVRAEADAHSGGGASFPGDSVSDSSGSNGSATASFAAGSDCTGSCSTGMGTGGGGVTTTSSLARDERAFLGGQPVKLWGLRCNNALLSPAVTERFVNNLDNMAAHGINLISVALQGTNGGFPDVDAGPNAFTSDGRLIPSVGRRLERIVREADRRGMVVLVVLMMPRKDQLLRDEAAVRRAIEESGAFLQSRGLRNVMVTLFQEFHHPTRIDHDIFREPDGTAKKAKLTAWFEAVAPDIEVGIVPNHLNGSPVEYPGCDVMTIHEELPMPAHGFVVNTETPDEDCSGNEGQFTVQSKARLAKLWRTGKDEPRLAMLFRTTFVEDVRGVMGTGPNAEMGGDGTGEGDRGIRFFYTWSREHLGRWEYPRHVRHPQ